MRNFSKKISILFISLLLCLSVFVPAYAEDQAYYRLSFSKNDEILLGYQATDSTTSGELEPYEDFDNVIDGLFVRYESSTKTFIICLEKDVVLDDYQILSTTNLEIVLTNNLTINAQNIPSITIGANTYTSNSQPDNLAVINDSMNHNLLTSIDKEINFSDTSLTNSFGEMPRSFRGVITVNGDLNIIGDKKFEGNFKYINKTLNQRMEVISYNVAFFCICSKLTVGDGYDKPCIVINEDAPTNDTDENALFNNMFMTVPFYLTGGLETNNAEININSYICGILTIGDFKVSKTNLNIKRKFSDNFNAFLYCSIAIDNNNDEYKPAIFEQSVVNITQELRPLRLSQQFGYVKNVSTSAIVSYIDLTVNDCYFNIELLDGCSLTDTLTISNFNSNELDTNEIEYNFNNSFVNLLSGVYFTNSNKLSFNGSTNFYISSFYKPLESRSDNPSTLVIQLNDEGTGLIEYNGLIETEPSYPQYYWCSGFTYDQNNFEHAIASTIPFDGGVRQGDTFDESNASNYCWVCFQKEITIKNHTGNDCFDIYEPKSFDSVFPELPGGIGLLGYFYENDYFLENDMSRVGNYLREDMYIYSKYENDNDVDPSTLTFVDDNNGTPSLTQNGYMPYYVDNNNHYFEKVDEGKFVRIYDLDKWTKNPARGLVKSLSDDNNIYEYSLTPNETIVKPISQEYKFKSNADFDKYAMVFVEENDGMIHRIDRSNYELKKGSTIIVFKDEYLAGLNDGDHQIMIVSKDGYAKGLFTVKGSGNPNPPYNPPSNPGYVVPQTGVK